MRTHGCGGHTVLAGTRLRDDTRFAHPPRQQYLPYRVVDLVRAGVAEILALEVDAGSAGHLSQARQVGEWRWPTDVLPKQRVELLPERWIGGHFCISRRKVIEDGNENLRYVGTTERTKAPFMVRIGVSSFHGYSL